MQQWKLIELSVNGLVMGLWVRGSVIYRRVEQYNERRVEIALSQVCGVPSVAHCILLGVPLQTLRVKRSETLSPVNCDN